MKTLRVALLASMTTLPARLALAQPSEDVDRSFPAPSAPARAPAPTFRHRALLGFGGGFLFGDSTKLNGESVTEGVPWQGRIWTTIGLELGLEERFSRLFSLAARARFFTANTEWASSVGYQRTRWDYGLEPRLWLQAKSAPRIEGYVGVGSGVTLASETPPPRRAYDERIEGRPGYYLSACVGGTYGFKNFAVFSEFGYAFHSMRVDATLEPRAPGVPHTVEERNYLGHALLFSLGVAFGFGAME